MVAMRSNRAGGCTFWGKRVKDSRHPSAFSQNTLAIVPSVFFSLRNRNTSLERFLERGERLFYNPLLKYSSVLKALIAETSRISDIESNETQNHISFLRHARE